MKLIFISALTIAGMLVACSSEPPAPPDKGAADMLPDTIGSTGIVRVAEVRLYPGESLWEYIDGGAELYHLYNFIEVATADYRKGEVELTADVYRFDSSLNAYGLYSMLRPDEPDQVMLGAEGFLAPATIMFVAGPFVVKVTGFVDEDESNLALVNLSDHLAHLISMSVRQTRLPAELALFPIEGRVPGSEKYWAQSFLGRDYLRSVFSVDYELDEAGFSLFLSTSQGAQQAAQWSEKASRAGDLQPAPEGLPFDDAKTFSLEDDYYGVIVAGACKGHLVGIVGYIEALEPTVTSWLQQLPTNSATN
jgi:hypothetical protein